MRLCLVLVGDDGAEQVRHRGERVGGVMMIRLGCANSSSSGGRILIYLEW